MRISPRRVIVNLKYSKLKGDVLDVSSDSEGIIYSLIKDNKETKSITPNCFDEDKSSYDSCAVFFALGTLNKLDARLLIDDIYQYIKIDGEVFIWDRVKEKKEIVRDKIIAKLPNDKEKSFELINLNPFYELNLSKCKKLLEKHFEIKETVIWDKVIYIRAVRKEIDKNLKSS